MPDRTRWVRLLAVGEGLLVSAIWASSFVIIKMGLVHLGPLTLAGLRYFAAFLFLLPLMALSGTLRRNPAPGRWGRLFLMGLLAYPVSNGALFWGLQYVPATTGAFLHSLLPLPSLVLALVWLREIPIPRQLLGLTVALAGSALFFWQGLGAGDPLALAVIGLGVVDLAVACFLPWRYRSKGWPRRRWKAGLPCSGSPSSIPPSHISSTTTASELSPPWS